MLWSVSRYLGASRRSGGLLPKQHFVAMLVCGALGYFTSIPLAAFAVTSAPEYQRPVKVSVDVRDAPKRLFHTQLTIPVHPGPLTLLYPKWIQGDASPSGPIVNLVGLKITSQAATLEWSRDLLNMYAFHCVVPSGSESVNVQFDYVSPDPAFTQFPDNVTATPKLAIVRWELLTLYPQGANPDEINYEATLTLPATWGFGTALKVSRKVPGLVWFSSAPLRTLIDSPVIAGDYFQSYLITDSPVRHEVDVVSDSPRASQAPAAWLDKMKCLIFETLLLFGNSYHYSSYHFLLSLSDSLPREGIEHHESSDNRAAERTLIDAVMQKARAPLLPHEFIHSWNGKYRRPVGLNTRSYEQPLTGDLLWVYEGLTRYLDRVLTTRSGLWTASDFRESTAFIAADVDHRTGRTWRSLEDTAVSIQILYDAGDEWNSWRRGTDYYDESLLIWLEADAMIRQQNNGRSLDDFCQEFYKGQNRVGVVPYTFDDIVSSLNKVAPFDWQRFFLDRVYLVSPSAPLGGLEKSGWKLEYSQVPNDNMRMRDSINKTIDLAFSAGLRLHEDGLVTDVIPGSPADRAGMVPGMRISAINGRIWSSSEMHQALWDATKTPTPIELTVENRGFVEARRVDYHGGEKYPHLVPIPEHPDMLKQILEARSNAQRSANSKP